MGPVILAVGIFLAVTLLKWAVSRESGWIGMLVLVGIFVGVLTFIERFHHDVGMMIGAISAAFLTGHFLAVELRDDTNRDNKGSQGRGYE